jgi:hypothetical protein
MAMLMYHLHILMFTFLDSRRENLYIFIQLRKSPYHEMYPYGCVLHVYRISTKKEMMGNGRSGIVISLFHTGLG